jgi:hypothetical protein
MCMVKEVGYLLGSLSKPRAHQLSGLADQSSGNLSISFPSQAQHFTWVMGIRTQVGPHACAASIVTRCAAAQPHVVLLRHRLLFHLWIKYNIE